MGGRGGGVRGGGEGVFFFPTLQNNDHRLPPETQKTTTEERACLPLSLCLRCVHAVVGKAGGGEEGAAAKNGLERHTDAFTFCFFLKNEGLQMVGGGV